MTYLLAAGLILGLTAASAGAAVEHSTRVDHHSGPVDVRYRGDIRIDHKQIGTVAPPGAPSTLRCVWKANMAVVRDAKAAGGTTMSRQFVRESIASGSRIGWCSINKAAIAKEVAARTRNLDRHMAEVAEEDVDILHVELDRHHGPARAG